MALSIRLESATRRAHLGKETRRDRQSKLNLHRLANALESDSFGFPGKGRLQTLHRFA